MKKKILAVALLLASFSAFAQVSIVKGVIKAETKEGERSLFKINTPVSENDNAFYFVNDISLLKLEDGEFKVAATTQLNEDGSFAFKFKPTYEGFYAIGYGGREWDKGQFPLYLKPGDNAEVSVNMNKFHVDLVGKNTPENQVLVSWANLIEEVKNMAVYWTSFSGKNYRDFFPVFETVVPKAEAFRKNINTKNATFNTLMKELTGYEMDGFALRFIYTPRSVHPKKEDMPAYYDGIVVKNKFPNNDIFSLPLGKAFLPLYVIYATRNMNPSPSFEDKLACLGTDLQKGEFLLLEKTPFFKYTDELDDMVSKYGNYLQTASQKKRIEELRPKLKVPDKGFKAHDFTYPDKDGKMVSLSDCLGKVIVVDIWATWCGPCKKEIPYLKSLEKELHGQDVVFMSVSTDKLEDKDKWLQMVNEMEMTGVQLLAGQGTKISQDYKINSIPRFLVIDKKGNIVSQDAPTPSDPRLKEMVVTALKN
ncbi:TlpA family protein disulfide reductase [Solitalea sp. MAHUQ-68]|uniref:TlpA family protein disulfide reductase n=1 Tax=Solitalea agri TaxID=2953739 RepID=A0A9X2JEK9_9SPHI|nr:TlpA disulfide reductase family protein [Solitalea agri]MCO4294055.1 TlpA family protein disulfide reductase [Solitalea agri]